MCVSLWVYSKPPKPSNFVKLFPSPEITRKHPPTPKPLDTRNLRYTRAHQFVDDQPSEHRPINSRPNQTAIMLAEGIRQIGDGLLEVAAERLKGLLVQADINEIYEVEQTPFARWVDYIIVFLCFWTTPRLFLGPSMAFNVATKKNTTTLKLENHYLDAAR